jgi:hypothetical protein
VFALGLRPSKRATKVGRCERSPATNIDSSPRPSASIPICSRFTAKTRSVERLQSTDLRRPSPSTLHIMRPPRARRRLRGGAADVLRPRTFRVLADPTGVHSRETGNTSSYTNRGRVLPGATCTRPRRPLSQSSPRQRRGGGHHSSSPRIPARATGVALARIPLCGRHTRGTAPFSTNSAQPRTELREHVRRSSCEWAQQARRSLNPR